MMVYLRQIYIEPGVSFSFSHLFQRWIGKELTAIVFPSAEFIRLYGEDFALIFTMSAKAEIRNVETRGPTVFRKAQEVEYTVFLPFGVISQSNDEIAGALEYLIDGVASVLESLKIDTTEVRKRTESIIRHVRSDASMIKLAKG